MKILSVVKRSLAWAVVVLAVVLLLLSLFAVMSMKGDRAIFGYRAYIVLSGSMVPTFEPGDLVISRETDTGELAAGDIISFRSADAENAGVTVTHKIRQRTVHEGSEAFVTYGIATGSDDQVPVPAENVLGRYVGRVAGLGNVISFLKTPTGYAVMITPILLLVLWMCVHFIRQVLAYRKQNSEETIETQHVDEQQGA